MIRNMLLCNLAMDENDSVLGFAAVWAKSIAERVAHLDVITMRRGQLDVPANMTVWEIDGPGEKGLSALRQSIRFYRILWAILRARKLDGCFSHMNHKMAILAAIPLRIMGCPVVTWYAHPKNSWSLRLAHHLSSEMITSVVNAYPYRKDKLRVIGQGIDSRLFNADYSDLPEEKVFLCVGRISRVKGHDTLIDGFKKARQRGLSDFRLRIVGDPLTDDDLRFRDEIINRMIDAGISDFVELLPGVPIHKLPNLYRQCAAHVNLTPTGFGDKVAWESMACGVPCLACNRDFANTFGSFSTSLLFEHRDSDTLSERMCSIASRTLAERRSMGRYLSGRVHDLHGLDQLVSRVLSIITEVNG